MSMGMASSTFDTSYVNKLKETYQTHQRITSNNNSNVQDLIGVVCTKCTQHNVMVLGDSRAGKSTFLKLLKDRDYTTDNNVFRSTEKPISESLHANYRGISMNITFIDTPGFNELSGDSTSRNDRLLQEEISSFLKNDIAYVNLVLIAVNAAVGLNQAQITSICNTLKFLQGFSSAAAILVTHFDLSGPEEEQRWISQFKANQKLKVINDVVKDRFIFTGALQKNLAENKEVKERYLQLQGDRIAKFFDLLAVSEPTYLINKNDSTPLSVKESAANSYHNIVNLPNVNKELEKKILENRLRLGEILEKDGDEDEYLKENGRRIKILLSRYSVIGTNNYVINEPSREVVESISKYREIEDEISRQSKKCCKQFDELNIINLNLDNEILGYEINRHKKVDVNAPEPDDGFDFSEITDDTEA